MTVPILKDDDLCCPNCGVVFEYRQESTHNEIRTSNLVLLGTALSEKRVYHFNEDRDLRLKENMLKFLDDICRKYSLPKAISHTVWLGLLRKNRGHWSKDNKVALKALVKLLERDDYYLLRNKLKLIKADYENSSF
jgi:hypothetical protein